MPRVCQLIAIGLHQVFETCWNTSIYNIMQATVAGYINMKTMLCRVQRRLVMCY